MTDNNITVMYRAPPINTLETSGGYNEASTLEEFCTMFTHPIFTKLNRYLDTADKIIAVFLVGAMLFITPAYATASIIKAHVKPVEKPMLSAMSIKVLTKAVGRVAQVHLVPTQDRLPTVRGR